MLPLGFVIIHNKNDYLVQELLSQGVLKPCGEWCDEKLGVVVKFYEGRRHYFAKVCYEGSCEEYVVLKDGIYFSDFRKIILYLALRDLEYHVQYLIDDAVDYGDTVLAKQYEKLLEFIRGMDRHVKIESVPEEEAWKQGDDQILYVYLLR